MVCPNALWYAIAGGRSPGVCAYVGYMRVCCCTDSAWIVAPAYGACASCGCQEARTAAERIGRGSVSILTGGRYLPGHNTHRLRYRSRRMGYGRTDPDGKSSESGQYCRSILQKSVSDFKIRHV